MAQKVSKFMVGLFVTIGVMLGIVAIIWVGASKYFVKGAMYVTYFDESVQGLQVDSAVKYRGVDIGTVEKIRVAPDNRLVGVVMKLVLPDVEGKVVSQLKAAGITGMLYVELNQRMPGEPDLSPRIEFAAEYPIIPSRPSQLKQIFSAVDTVVDKIKQVDIVGISNQIKDSMRSVEIFLKDRKLQSILVNLESATTKLDSTIGRIDAIIAAGNVEVTLLEVKTAFTDARTLIANVRDTLEAMDLPEAVSQTAGKAQQLVDDLDRRSRKITVEAGIAVENLRRASENLDRLIERLNMNPSDIIFSEPPVPQQRE